MASKEGQRHTPREEDKRTYDDKGLHQTALRCPPFHTSNIGGMLYGLVYKIPHSADWNRRIVQNARRIESV